MQDKRVISKIIKQQKQKSLRQLNNKNSNRNPEDPQQGKFKQKSINILSDDKQNLVFSFRKNDHKQLIKSQQKQTKELSFLSQNQQTFYEDQQINEQKSNLIKQINKSNKTVIQKKINSHNKQTKLIQFLQDCKLSIISLQQQNQQKDNQIKQLKLSINKLNQKLQQSQSHIKRQNQLLALYIKQTNSTQSQSQNVQIKEYLRISQLKLQIDSINKLNVKLRYQNQDLLTKISKMGKGVSKALQTISKNSKTDQKMYEHKFKQITTPQKLAFKYQTASSRKIGRISNVKQMANYQSPFIYSRKQTTRYQSPLIYNKPLTQVYQSERKLYNLEQQYKKLNKIQKQQHFETKFRNLQDILQKMNKFAQDSDSSDNQQWIQHASFSTE